MLKETINILISRYDFFIPLIYEHLAISFITIAIAMVIGITLGVIISEHKIFSSFILATTNIIYTIPAIALLGFLIPFSGIGNLTAIIALTIYALLPMVRNTYTGITNITPSIIETAIGMGSTKFQILYKIKLPLAMPVIISGLRNMVVMTIALAGIASFIGAGGLGVAIYRGITTNNMAMTLAGSILIAMLALISDYSLGLLERLINKKRYKLFKIITTVIAVIIITLIIFSISRTHEKIKIATKPMTEQFILAEILKLIIEDQTNLDVEITKGIGGGTSNIHPAILKGDFDIYPEYSGTAWKFVLKHVDMPDSDKLINQMQAEYLDRYNLRWVGYYGFNNRFGIAIRSDIAEVNNINTYSDLANIASQLTIGAEYDFFERDDGYQALANKYNMNFKNRVDMDIGLKYQAINSREVDVINLFTTDAMISVSKIKILEDDKEFFEDYFCGTVVRADLFKKYPELEDVLMIMDNLINDSEMANLNYQVEVENKRDKDVAYDFLIRKKIIE